MQAGVRTVADLLAVKPQAIGLRIGDEEFDSESIEAWQREAELVIAAPHLPSQAARVLAIVGFHNPARIARSTPIELLAAIEVAVDQEHRASWLRKNSRPSVSELADWIRCAQQSLTDWAA